MSVLATVATHDGKGNVTLPSSIYSATHDTEGNVTITARAITVSSIKDEVFVERYVQSDSTVFNDWVNDLPQQFKNKYNIEILIKAFSRQLDELYEAVEQVKNLNINTATGVNLDYEGNILSITRKDAQTILKTDNAEGIDDELFRSVLKYRALQLNCNCTCDEIITSITMLWDTSEITYLEDPERPGYVFIVLPSVSIDGQDPSVGRVLSIRPSGVSVIYTIDYALDIGQLVEMKADVPEIIMTTGLESLKPVLGASSIEFGVMEMASFSNDIDGTVTATHNLWCLDGTYALDGTKLIDAYQIKEEL